MHVVKPAGGLPIKMSSKACPCYCWNAAWGTEQLSPTDMEVWFLDLCSFLGNSNCAAVQQVSKWFLSTNLLKMSVLEYGIKHSKTSKCQILILKTNNSNLIFDSYSEFLIFISTFFVLALKYEVADISSPDIPIFKWYEDGDDRQRSYRISSKTNSILCVMLFHFFVTAGNQKCVDGPLKRHCAQSPDQLKRTHNTLYLWEANFIQCNCSSLSCA